MTMARLFFSLKEIFGHTRLLQLWMLSTLWTLVCSLETWRFGACSTVGSCQCKNTPQLQCALNQALNSWGKERYIDTASGNESSLSPSMSTHTNALIQQNPTCPLTQWKKRCSLTNNLNNVPTSQAMLGSEQQTKFLQFLLVLLSFPEKSLPQSQLSIQEGIILQDPSSQISQSSHISLISLEDNVSGMLSYTDCQRTSQNRKTGYIPLPKPLNYWKNALMWFSNNPHRILGRLLIQPGLEGN